MSAAMGSAAETRSLVLHATPDKILALVIGDLLVDRLFQAVDARLGKTELDLIPPILTGLALSRHATLCTSASTSGRRIGRCRSG